MTDNVCLHGCGCSYLCDEGTVKLQNSCLASREVDWLWSHSHHSSLQRPDRFYCIAAM